MPQSAAAKSYSRSMFARILMMLVVMVGSVGAQTQPEWTTNHVPFRVVGNVYYVGSEDLGAYLITTPQGNILINANLESSVPQIKKNIETLGFRFADTKILLNSQAHFDHVGGAAELKRLTGVQVETMEGDVSPMESGGKTDFYFYNKPEYYFEPVKVDRVLHDGDTVKLGGMVLTAHKTAGHTMGDTTWTFPVKQDGKTYQVLIFGGASALSGYNLIDDPRYPKQAADFVQTFRTLSALPCDVFLGGHGQYFGLKEKYARMVKGDRDAFVDTAGYKAYVEDAKKEFEADLAKQTAARKK
jgi:metallo-beta-lactamase class B